MTAFTAKGTDLFDALSNVSQHVSDDKTLSALTAVEVTVDEEGLITLVGTDRYSLAVAEVVITLDGTHEPGTFLLSSDMTKAAIKAAKLIRAGDVTVSADENTITVTTFEGTTSGRTEIGQFPKWKALWPDDTDEHAHSSILFSRSNLAKLTKVFANGGAVTRGVPVWTFRFGATSVKPVVATSPTAPDFRVLLMPRRPAA